MGYVKRRSTLGSDMVDQNRGANLLARIVEHSAVNGMSQQFAVKNPATGKVIARVPDFSAEDVERVVSAAQRAMPEWQQRTAQQRADALMIWHDLIVAEKFALAELLTAEQGKPIREAEGEIGYAASFIKWFAEEGKRAYGEIVPTNASSRRLLVLKQPIGVVAAITPWNFPSAMITRKVAPALAAGCPIIVKPAEDTPLSALALELLAHQAGLPADLFRVVTSSDPVSIGATLTGAAAIRKLSFTGSTATGKKIMRACADSVKKVALELGGNAPFIVFESADLDAAADGAILSKFRNAGQTCVCANRILVQDTIKDAFISRFAERAEKLSIGNGIEPSTDIGPLINESAIRKVSGLLNDSVKAGATVATGGGVPVPDGDLFLRPTILTDVSPSMLISQTEIFGPIAPVMTFRSEADAIRMANDTPYGLAAYMWTKELGQTWRVSEALEFGMIGVNEGVISSEAAPFGGIKESGIGREGSRHGLDEYLELKYIAMGGLA